MNARFVTAFTPEMFAVSGRKLLESYDAVWQPAQCMLVGQQWPDAVQASLALAGLPAICLNVLEDQRYTTWREENADVIPTALGGTLDSCRCPPSQEPDPHAYGCPLFRWNRNASLWLRKVIALLQASEVCGGRLIWIDSDSTCRATFTQRTLDRWFDGDSAFFAWGTRRLAPQTGIMGIDLDMGGRAILAKVWAWYTSKQFRTLERWDDGFVFGKVFRECGGHDLAANVAAKNPFPETSLDTYFAQEKGLHQRMGLML